MPAVDYLRVSRRRRTPAGSSELWLANDHLLLVMRNWWTERYQRFRLSEIQSIVAVERPSLRALQIVGAIVTASLCALVILSHGNLAARILLGIPLHIALAWQVVDLLRGPYCRVELTTAVSSVRLAPLTRIRAARAFLENVIPLIESVQGPMAPAAPVPPLPGLTWTMSGTPAPPPLPAGPKSGVELILFSSCLVLGIYGVIASRMAMHTLVSTVSWTVAGLPLVLGGMAAAANPHMLTRILGAIAAVTALIYGGAGVTNHFSALFAAAKQGERAVRVTSQLTPPWASGQPLGIVLAIVGLIGLLLAVTRKPEAN
jgi:hypothetical protein